MSQPNDSTAIRTAGLVLCGIGVVAWFATLGWNAMGDYPDEPSLIAITGRVELAEVREISTRTSIANWEVIEVTSSTGTADANERWVFPAHHEIFEAAIEGVEVGEELTVRVRPDPELLRWSEEPVRIIWSLSRRGEEVVSYAQTVGILDAARYQSPAAAFAVIGVGLALMLLSRMRLSRVPEPSV